jgi:hypothetical protein
MDDAEMGFKPISTPSFFLRLHAEAGFKPAFTFSPDKKITLLFAEYYN